MVLVYSQWLYLDLPNGTQRDFDLCWIRPIHRFCGITGPRHLLSFWGKKNVVSPGTFSVGLLGILVREREAEVCFSLDLS